MKGKTSLFNLWIIGLSGSGKSTLGTLIYNHLISKGKKIKYLDGDILRLGLNNDLGFSDTDRLENIRRIAHVNKLFNESNFSTINAFICPTNEAQNLIKTILGDTNVLVVYLNTPLSICENRDAKGLYKKARMGIIENFTGINAGFEIPISADLTIDTSKLTIEQSFEITLGYLEQNFYNRL